MSMGVYAVHNRVTQQDYIGQSIDLELRWSQHRYELRRGRHPNPRLQHAWTKYGEQAFTFRVLEVVTDAMHLDGCERKHGHGRHNLYNIAPLGCAQHRLRDHRQPYSDATARRIERAFRELEQTGALIRPKDIANQVHRSIGTVYKVLEDAPYWTNEHIAALRAEAGKIAGVTRKARGYPGLDRSIATRRAQGFPELQRSWERQAALGHPNARRAHLANIANGHPGPRVSAERRRGKPLSPTHGTVIQAERDMMMVYDALMQALSTTTDTRVSANSLARMLHTSTSRITKYLRRLHVLGLIDTEILNHSVQSMRRVTDTEKERVVHLFQQMASEYTGVIPSPSVIGQMVGIDHHTVTRILRRVGLWTDEVSRRAKEQGFANATKARDANRTHKGYSLKTEARVRETIEAIRARGAVPIPKEIAQEVGVTPHQVYVILRAASYWTAEDDRRVTHEICRRARAGRWGKKPQQPTQLSLF